VFEVLVCTSPSGVSSLKDQDCFVTAPALEALVALAGIALKPTTNMVAVAMIAAIFLNMDASPIWTLFVESSRELYGRVSTYILDVQPDNFGLIV
jgi:hypothetical protein